MLDRTVFIKPGGILVDHQLRGNLLAERSNCGVLVKWFLFLDECVLVAPP
jgi:hypothetical protein